MKKFGFICLVLFSTYYIIQQLFAPNFTESPPILKLPPKGSHCPTEFDGWRDLGGENCYYFETENALSFYEALFDCKRRGKYILLNFQNKYSNYCFETLFYVFLMCTKKLFSTNKQCFQTYMSQHKKIYIVYIVEITH